MIDYAKMTVPQIKQTLIQEGYKPGFMKGMSKERLVHLHKINDRNKSLAARETPTEKPECSPDDEGWRDYVLNQLREGEFILEGTERKPRVNGLVRLVRKLVGTIDSSISRVITPPNYGTGTCVFATVECEVTLTTHDGFERRVTDVADVNPSNTDGKFLDFASSVCATRAESRCLRKLLNLYNTISAEETNMPAVLSGPGNGTPNDNVEKITEAQVKALGAMSKRLKIDLLKVIQAVSPKAEDISDINRDEGKLVLEKLNNFQRDQSSIPENFKEGA